MTPATLSAIRSILGSHFSEARAKALYRVVLEGELAASRDHEPTTGIALEGDVAAAYANWLTTERLRHQRIEEYNARLKVVNGARRDGDWSAKIDLEYRRMTDASSAASRALESLSKAALSSADQVPVKAPGMPSKLSEEEVG